MIFARYIGPPANNWTPGKIYFVMSGFDGGAVDVEEIRLQDDNDQWQEVKTKDGLFSFPPFVYAVCLHPIHALVKGEVIKVTNYSDGFFEVEWCGYQKADNFEILDRTNVTLGSKVLDKKLGLWEEISRLDDDLNIGTMFFNDDLVSPSTFRFPVGKDGLLAEPLLKCVKGQEGELTEGKVYSPTAEKDGLVTVINDTGKPCQYLEERFIGL